MTDIGRIAARGTRSLRAIATIAAAGALLAVTATSEAGVYSATGVHGYTTTPTGVCRYNLVRHDFTLRTRPPKIFAPDIHYGYGNDSAYARYRLFVFGPSGNILGTSGWSGWGEATDNTPAAFSGSTTFTRITGGRLVVQVQWYGYGSVSEVETRYHYYMERADTFLAITFCGFSAQGHALIS